MILRRFAAALKDQNWTTITIEFVLLVCGVFLGIQAANWNQTQRDHEREAEYVARLGRDFDRISARLAENIARWEVKADAPVRLLEDMAAYRMQGIWPRPKKDIIADLDNTFDSRIPAPRSATYVELLSAGDLGLLRNSRLRDALLDYDMQVGYSHTAYDVLMQRVAPHMPVLVLHLEFNGTARRNAKDAAALDTDIWVDGDLAGLADDPEVATALKIYASASLNQLQVAKLQRDKAQAVLAALQ